VNEWDDFWETMFVLFVNPWVLLAVIIVLVVLSATGVIPWGEWL
jgi:hypothetical protein